MDTSTTDSETTSPPATYQCIVCQMTMVSVGSLHRHQTYQHTPEELSLSTIGLQCLFINNIHVNNSIVYDNSWLCDPMKQAEFYTVSAILLNDSDNNANDSVPIDYALERARCNLFKKEDNTKSIDRPIGSENFAKEKKIVFDSVIDCSCKPVASLGSESLKNVIKTERFIDIDTEANNSPRSPDNVVQADKSRGMGTEASRIPESPEKKVTLEKAEIIATNGDHICESLEKVIKGDEPEGFGTELDLFFNSVEGLCSDLQKIKNKPQKRKKIPSNPAPGKAKAKPRKRALWKKSKTSDPASNNNTDTWKHYKQNSAKKDLANKDCVARSFDSQEPANSVKYNFATEDIVEVRSNVPDIEIKSKGAEIAAKNDSISSNRLERNFEETKIQISNELNLEHGYSIGNQSETYSNQISIIQDFADTNPVEIESTTQQQKISFGEDIANGDNSEYTENFLTPALPTFPFPLYPPDINDYSILVLDPEAHQLVWTSVAIVDAQDKLHSDTLQEIQVLPELTELDLQDSEICENISISSDSREKESSKSSFLQSQTKGPAMEDRTKSCTNFVLRPRRTKTK